MKSRGIVLIAVVVSCDSPVSDFSVVVGVEPGVFCCPSLASTVSCPHFGAARSTLGYSISDLSFLLRKGSRIANSGPLATFLRAESSLPVDKDRLCWKRKSRRRLAGRVVLPNESSLGLGKLFSTLFEGWIENPLPDP